MFLEALVDLVLLYGTEVWECCRQTNPLVQVQLRVTRISFGVDRLYSSRAIESKQRNENYVVSMGSKMKMY